MAEGDVERVRDGLAVLNSLDPETIAQYAHPDVEWVPLRAGTEGTYRGLTGLQRFVQDTREIFESWEVETDDLREVAEGCVLVVGAVHARTRAGLDVKQPVAALNWVRDGRIVRHEAYTTEAEALEALERR